MNRRTKQHGPTVCSIRGAVRVQVSGRVQGVGFRPEIARFAKELFLAGRVCNTSTGVEIVVEGPCVAIDRFLRRLKEEPPTLAEIADIVVSAVSLAEYDSFEIAVAATARPLRTAVPLDLAVCPKCLADVDSPDGRRTEYPFTSCAHCGPRYSILNSLPYERSATAMAGFTMCQSCKGEYQDATDRRFHAETISCPQCGPACWLADSAGNKLATGRYAVEAARAAVRRGQIVALRGIGGYQLLADATNAEVIARLRMRKQRPAKPLALMIGSLDVASQFAFINREAELALTAVAGPIVVLSARPDSSVAAEVCCGLTEIGLMLPTSPLHSLIALESPPLVATSGNVEGRPLEHEIDASQRMLGNVADLFLHHDRAVLRPIDDSVVKVISGMAVTLRAGRGIAPLPLEIGFRARERNDCVLAVGGQQNNAIALWNGNQAVLGPHVGDLDELATCERWHQHRRDFCDLFDAKPSLIVHDLHPDYYTTRWAADSDTPTLAVQHHHAHVAAAMLEHRWLDREILGVAWDGTGLGPDGTIWGGEFLVANAMRYKRVARLRPFVLQGGEAAIRQPWRISLALLVEVMGAEAAIHFFVDRGWDRRPLSQITRAGCRNQLWPQTSSIGRLFDAVAAIVLPFDHTHGGCSQYEGQLAMLLESSCQWSAYREADDDHPASYPFPLRPGEPLELDWCPLIAALVADCQRGQQPSTVARRFHAALAKAIGAVSDRYSDLPVAVCGGVFQNRVLTEMAVQQFARRHQPLGTPGIIPPGDGGLAAGQLVIGLASAGNCYGIGRITK